MLVMAALFFAEAEHFERCPVCGQDFDMCHLGQVLHHAEPEAPTAAASELKPARSPRPPGSDCSA
jgi:hypothetical protein